MIDTLSDSVHELIGSDGIFLRVADRRRFDYVMRAVSEQSLSLSISSDHDGVLDHVGRLVINKLRRMEGLQIEVFLPANTEALLDRYNQILAGLSLEDARNPDNSPAPRRVLIAHDAKAISPRDLQLLSRLTQDFPGANVSLVLLVDRTGALTHEKTLESFGQRLLRWPLEQPTRAEGEELLAIARGLGFEVEVRKVLASTGFAPEIKPPPVLTDDSEAERALTGQRRKRSVERTEPVLGDASHLSATPDAHSAPAADTPVPRRRRFAGLLLRWMLALVLLLAVSIGVIVLLFPQRAAPLLANSPILKDNLPPWAMTLVIDLVGKPPSAALDEPAPAPATSAEASVPPAQADSSDKEVPSETPPQAATPAAEPVAAEAPPATPTTPPAAAKTDATSTPEAPAEPVKSAAAEALAPRSERGVDQLIRQTKAGAYFVQHVSLGAMAEAQEWRAQYPALAKAKIVAVTTQDQGVKFAVVSGPFATLKEAEAFAARQGVPSDPWLRPVKSLQRALLPAAR